jgi:hypothetical protein
MGSACSNCAGESGVDKGNELNSGATETDMMPPYSVQMSAKTSTSKMHVHNIKSK